MHAVCFKCGEEKKFPLKMCTQCQAIPQDDDDRIASFSLSAKCLKDKNLLKASNYIKLKKKLPRFHESVTNRAKKMVEDLSDSSSSLSFELSESFFDLKADPSGEQEKQTVTVHAIGKPPGSGSEHSGPVSRAKTYQMLKWEIGKDISAEQVRTYMDHFGCIYVWYRWIDKGWTWKCVSKVDFDNLRKVER